MKHIVLRLSSDLGSTLLNALRKAHGAWSLCQHFCCSNPYSASLWITYHKSVFHYVHPFVIKETLVVLQDKSTCLLSRPSPDQFTGRRLRRPKWFSFPLITIIFLTPLPGRASGDKSSIKQDKLHMYNDKHMWAGGLQDYLVCSSLLGGQLLSHSFCPGLGGRP